MRDFRRVASAAAISAGVTAVLVVAWPASRSAATHPPGQPSLASDAARGLLHACMHHAHLVHDVRWAAACSSQPDSSVDCMLPNEQAAVLNQALERAEARCRSDAAQAGHALR